MLTCEICNCTFEVRKDIKRKPRPRSICYKNECKQAKAKNWYESNYKNKVKAKIQQRYIENYKKLEKDTSKLEFIHAYGILKILRRQP